jgi:hypothetical protein
MSRRDQWKQAASKAAGELTKVKTFEERERVPEKACGLCKNFSENAYASDGRGICTILRGGSDIEVSPAVYVMEGDIGLITFFNADGAGCKYFAKNVMIDKDGSECADPVFRRMQRQMEKLV